MSLPVQIVDKDGFTASVTSAGQVITAPYKYDTTEVNKLSIVDTAYNFYLPVPGWRFIITGVIAKADKGVSSTVDAIVTIYEASAGDSTTVDRTLIEVAMSKSGDITLLPLNIAANKGVWINAKSTDVNIYMTIMGYTIPA